MNILSYPPISSRFLLDQPTHGISNTTNDIQGIIINNQHSHHVNETLSFKLLRGYQLPSQFYSQYSLEKELGSGGFGFVASIKEKATGQERAIKFIYKNKLPASSWITHQGQHLPIEIYILQHVHHPAIVDYVDSFEDDTFFYLVMELHGSPWHPPSDTSFSSTSSDTSNIYSNNNDDTMQQQHQDNNNNSTNRRRGSCDLFECLEQHRTLDESLAKTIFRQIIECVTYLDTIGICHRDLKDENFVIDRNYKVKLIDFGSAVLLPRHFNDNKAVVLQSQPFYGTLGYASPEILRMEPYQAELAEVWSLGVLLYMLVFAKMPFTTPHMVLTQIPRPSSTKASVQCLHLISWLLEKSPSKRPTVHQIWVHPWLQQE